MAKKKQAKKSSKKSTRKKKESNRFKDVLIVLGCGPKPDGRPSDAMLMRVRKAIGLYRKNTYSKIILTGGPTTTPVPESEVMKIMMLKYVPAERILTERNSRDTIQNAVFCWEILKDRKPKHITVVTSQFHIRRARYIFNKLYSHMSADLRFESAENHFDPIAGIYYRLKEVVLLARLKLFGFGIPRETLK